MAKARRRAGRQAVKILAINTACAFIPPILLLVMSTDPLPPRRLLITFLFSLVYSHSIGSLNFLIMPRIWGCLPRLQEWLRWSIRIGGIFGNTIAGCLFACLIFVALGLIPWNSYWMEFWASLKIAVFLALLAGVTIGIYETFQWRLEETRLQLQAKDLERERALKLATEAQLASLESRIHPHFLFNTLNSISSLIPEDPVRAERLVERMAALLRFSLDANQAGVVPLSSEMKVVADYLEIERARFGDRLRFEISVPSDLDAVQVPPLAIQTLVENSVKYAVAPNRAGGEICVTGTRENGHVKVRVSDDGPRFALESAPPGHGLDNLKERLRTLYGSRGSLTLERSGEHNRITLLVPQNGSPNSRIPG